MSPSESSTLPLFVHCLKKVPDPSSKHGTSHPFRTILALVFLGLLGNVTTLAEIERWTKLHFAQLKKFLRLSVAGQEQSTEGVEKDGGNI